MWTFIAEKILFFVSLFTNSNSNGQLKYSSHTMDLENYYSFGKKNSEKPEKIIIIIIVYNDHEKIVFIFFLAIPLGLNCNRFIDRY